MSEVEQREPLTGEELEVMFVAWTLAARGQSVSYRRTNTWPAAESMEAKGWLSAHTLDNGDAAYEFTPEGEAALETLC